MAAKFSYPYANTRFNNGALTSANYLEILNILSRNKVLLTCYSNSSNTSQEGTLLELRKSIKERIDKEKHLIVNIGQKIREIDRLLERHRISYLLPKYTFFYREHNDVDVLVSSDDFNRTLKSLRSEDYVITSIQSPWKVTTAKWIRGRRSSIHVHSRLHWYHWDPLEHIPSEKLWQRSILIDDNSSKLPVPCPEDAILVSAAHSIFENHEVSLSDIFQIDGIVRRYESLKWNDIVDIAFEKGWCFDLIAFLSVVDYLSSLLYDRTLVPNSFFLCAEKKMPLLERTIRKFVGNVDLSAIPCSYPYAQLVISFIQVISRGYGVNMISKIMEGIVQRTIYQLRDAH